MQQSMYDLVYYIYILFFGAYASLRIARGPMEKRGWKLLSGICPALLIIQGLCLQLWGMDLLWQIYPLVVHLPIALAIIAVLRVQWPIALVSVTVSYSLCQLPRWIGLVLQMALSDPLACAAVHIACSLLVLILLDRRSLDNIHDALCGLNRHPFNFGALPMLYYLYEYFMICTQQRYAYIQALNELLPTVLVFAYILFSAATRQEMEKLDQAHVQNATLEMQLKHAEQEFVALRAIQEQTAIHRHDLRHHLMMIDSLLASGKQDQAAAYIRQVNQEIDRITPQRYCENETVNLLLGAFREKTLQGGGEMHIRASLPLQLNMPDTELCALLSNGLENALNAACALPENQRRIDVYCGMKQGKLLIEIKNPYAGEICFQDGLPIAANHQRRYGCRSIQSIVQQRRGMCTFDAGSGIFILRIAIPMEERKAHA